MQEEDFQNIVDYLDFQGFHRYDYEPLILHLDKELGAQEFTEGLVQALVKSLFEDLKSYPEDLKDCRVSLLGLIEEEFEKVCNTEEG